VRSLDPQQTTHDLPVCAPPLQEGIQIGAGLDDGEPAA
jgi:hypothetical protein